MIDETAQDEDKSSEANRSVSISEASSAGPSVPEVGEAVVLGPGQLTAGTEELTQQVLARVGHARHGRRRCPHEGWSRDYPSPHGLPSPAPALPGWVP